MKLAIARKFDKSHLKSSRFMEGVTQSLVDSIKAGLERNPVEINTQEEVKEILVNGGKIETYVYMDGGATLGIGMMDDGKFALFALAVPVKFIDKPIEAIEYEENSNIQ